MEDAVIAFVAVSSADSYCYAKRVFAIAAFLGHHACVPHAKDTFIVANLYRFSKLQSIDVDIIGLKIALDKLSCETSHKCKYSRKFQSNF